MKDENPNPQSSRSQCAMMRKWFMDHKGVRVTEKFFDDEFGISKTATRVSELIRGVFGIALPVNRDEWREMTNRYGKKIKVKQYYLPVDYQESFAE